MNPILIAIYLSHTETIPSAAYSGTSLAFRDRLIIDWNKTQQRQTFADQKRIYCTKWTPTLIGQSRR